MALDKTLTMCSTEKTEHDKDAEDGFYTLIPRDSRFVSDTVSTNNSNQFDVKQNTYIEDPQFTIKRKEFLEYFGYENKSEDTLRSLLYMKEPFILNGNLLNKSTKADHEDAWNILKILMADQCTLFSVDAASARNQAQNRNYISERKHQKRILRSRGEKQTDTEKRDAIQKAIQLAMPSYCYKKDDNALALISYDNAFADIDLETALLKIVNHTASKKLSVYEWLYSNAHIGITSMNRDEYKEHWRSYFDSEEVSIAKKEYPIDNAEQKKFIRSIVKQNNPWNTWLLDMKKCSGSIKSFFSEEDWEKLSLHKVDFIIKCLAEYAHAQQVCYAVAEEFEKPHKPEMQFNDQAGFLFRYKRLTELEASFNKPIRNKLWIRKTSFWVSWTNANSDEMKKTNTEIAKEVEKFFENIGSPLRKGGVALLVPRINWIMCAKQTAMYSKEERPLLLLGMLLAGKKGIIPDDEFEFDSPKAYSYKFRRVFKAEQQYAEITFLNAIHNALEFTQEEQDESWRLYISIRGHKILSRKLLNLWKSILGEDYERLPEIGFQLCVLEYAEHCISPHLESLSYSSGTRAHLGGYYTYYQKHQKEIEELAETISKQEQWKEDIRAYQKLWFSPGVTYKTRRDMIQNIVERKQFSNHSVMQDCPDNEYQCLVIETALRMHICKKATTKLLKWFEKIYDCKLIWD